MSDLLNIFSKMWKRDQIQGLASILLLFFCREFTGSDIKKKISVKL